MIITAAELADHLNPTRYRRSWRGRCPCRDYLGTFSVRAGRDGRALFYCASCQDRDALNPMRGGGPLRLGQERQGCPLPGSG